MAHKALDEWFDGEMVPLFEQGERPSLEALSQRFQATRRQLLGGALQGVVERLYAPYLEQRTASCPRCDKTLKRKRVDEKKISTLQGEFSLARPYFYCPSCGQGFHPLDQALGLAREVHQYDIQAEITRLGADLPFQRTAEHFERLTGVTAGNHFSHQTLNAVGAVATLECVIPSREQIGEQIRVVRGSSRRRPVLVVATDGAHAPTRPAAKRKQKRGPGGYQEVKGVRIVLVGQFNRIVQVASWHQLQDAEAFTADLKRIAERIPQDHVRIALLGDGSEWLWRAMRTCFPEGREVLDYYHCSEHLHSAAYAQYGETFEARQWVEAVAARLFTDRGSLVVGGLRRMTPRNPEANEAIDNLIGYLSKRLDQINYRSARRSGIPIGSGGIESANKFICHRRLKLSGAWWLRENTNSMLRVRCAIYNGTFDRVFENYKRRYAKTF